MKKQIVSAINYYIVKKYEIHKCVGVLMGLNVLYNDFLFYRIAKK